MAIPMLWPAYEEPELDALLEHLLIAIRQIADLRRLRRLRRLQTERRNRASQEPAASASHGPAAMHPSEFSHHRFQNELPTAAAPPADSPATTNLPDLLSDLTPNSKPDQTELQTQTSWMQTGADLRQIADAFEQLRTPQENNAPNRKQTKDVGLLSALCPSLVNSLWPVLAFVVGWNLLSRTR